MRHEVQGECEVVCPVMDSQQVRNRGLRDMGIAPRESYHCRGIGPGDVAEVLEVERSPFTKIRYVARIAGIEDHGEYSVVWVDPLEGGERRAVTLFSAGPPDWGVIRFKVLQKVWVPLVPSAERDGRAWLNLQKKSGKDTISPID